MLARRDLIELGVVTNENYSKFGCSIQQIMMINQLLFDVDDTTHSYVLDNIFKDGMMQAKKLITVTDAEKLINSLIDGTEFRFVQYNSYEWHEHKKQEKIKKMLQKKQIV